MKRETNSTRQIRSPFVAAIILLAIIANPVIAQKLEPVLDANPTDTFETSSLEIKQVYNLTEVARTIEDFERIIARCEDLLEKSIRPKDRKYLTSLIAWSKNRIGKQYVKNAVSMGKMGLSDQSKGQLELAIKQFDELIKNNPMTWRAWMNRAKIHVMLGEFEPALEKFIEVTKLNREQSGAWFNAAELSLLLERFDEAIGYYSRLIDENPTDTQALTGRGHCHLAKEDIDAAISDYKTVVKLQPNNENALCNLGDALMKSELWTEALSTYESAARIEDAVTGNERLARFLVKCGDKNLRDPNRAISLAKVAIQKNPSSVVFAKTLAAAYSANDQPELAQEVLREANSIREAQKRETTTK